MSLTLLTSYCSTLNYVGPGHAGLAYNMIDGTVDIQDHAGWQPNSPFTLITNIDTRPQKLCIMSSAHAAVNCKLVQFDTRYYREFVAVEGWHYFWWSNRFSFNSGHQETYRGWRDVLRGYAFSSQQYPFIKVLKEE